MSKEQIIGILIVTYIVLRAFIFEPNSIEVKKYSIQNPTLKGVRIVFFSDLHLQKNTNKKLEKIVNLINDQNPDVVISGGDYVRSPKASDSLDASTIARKLSFIKAPVVTVFGEYDYKFDDGRGIYDLRNEFKKNGIKTLENSSVGTTKKNKYFNITGLNDISQEQNISKAARGTANPRILVTHNPDVYFTIIDRFDLILAGHTHGGQIIIPFTPPLFSPSQYKFKNGLIKPNTNQMIITKGIGVTGLPVRLNCKPEIVVIDFI